MHLVKWKPKIGKLYSAQLTGIIITWLNRIGSSSSRTCFQRQYCRFIFSNCVVFRRFYPYNRVVMVTLENYQTAHLSARWAVIQQREGIEFKLYQRFPSVETFFQKLVEVVSDIRQTSSQILIVQLCDENRWKITNFLFPKFSMFIKELPRKLFEDRARKLAKICSRFNAKNAEHFLWIPLGTILL